MATCTAWSCVVAVLTLGSAWGSELQCCHGCHYCGSCCHGCGCHQWGCGWWCTWLGAALASCHCCRCSWGRDNQSCVGKWSTMLHHHCHGRGCRWLRVGQWAECCQRGWWTTLLRSVSLVSLSSWFQKMGLGLHWQNACSCCCCCHC